MYLNLFDSHLHSDNSWDAEHSITFLCETAVKKGYLGIAVTDHCEINEYIRRQGDLRIKQGRFEMMKARAAFGNSLKIAYGIELGQMHHDERLRARVFSLADFDFVLGSLHCVRGEEDFYFIDFSQTDPVPLVEKYYDELLEIAAIGQFDAMAHITYPFRYINGKYGCGLDIHRFDGQLEALLRRLAESGKALEINTADLGRQLADTSPPLYLIRRFKELGGELITLGSDAHSAGALGAGIEEGMSIAREAGFEYFAYYFERRPRMIGIY